MAEPQQILIVEDQVNTAEMLATYFTAQGYAVTSKAWGKDALAHVEEHIPDLIVLDIRLPDMDGYQICRHLRSQSRTRHVPILFLTERRERIDRLAGLELGAVDYMTKPFDVQELRLRVRNILRRANLEPVLHSITGLPVGALVDEQLQNLQQRAKSNVLLLTVRDIDHFGNLYGFVARDDVLRAIGVLVTHVVGEVSLSECFVGQLSEDVFVILVDPATSDRLVQLLRTRLDEAVAFFYPHVDWESGYRSSDRAELPRLRVDIKTVKAGELSPYKDIPAVRDAMLNISNAA